MGFNSGQVLSSALKYIDPQVITPAKGDLLGRKLWKTKQLPKTQTTTYEYTWKELMGQVSDTTNRATDGTVSDVTYHSDTGFITGTSSSLDYSVEELSVAKEAGIDILLDKTEATHQALVDWEDRLIFNGLDDSRHPIYGATSDPAKTGYQVAEDAPVTLDKLIDPENAGDSYTEAMKIYNWLVDSANKIKFLPGYSHANLVLCLPPNELSMLERPYNKYSPKDTVINMLQGTNTDSVSPVFSKIVAVPEFEAKYWNTAKGAAGKKDMGLIFVDDPKVVNIPVAMNITRDPFNPYPDHGKYSMTYRERMGGLCVKFPAGFVRLNGIN